MTTISSTISINLSCLSWDENGLTIAGAQNGEFGQALNRLYGPRDLIVDNENIYVSDTLNKRLLKFIRHSSEVQTLVQGETLYGLSLNQEEQAIYFSQESGSYEVIKRVNKNGGDPSIVVPIQQISRSYSLVAFEGKIYICDTSKHRVVLWSNINRTLAIVAGDVNMGFDSNQLRTPEGIFVDVNRNVYVADTLNHRIQLWKNGASNGITVAGSSNLGSDLHQLNSPRAVFVDSGTMFIADSEVAISTTITSRTTISSAVPINFRCLTWDENGVTIAGAQNGDSGLAPNRLYDPRDLIVDSENIYVSDTSNRRLLKFANHSAEGQSLFTGDSLYGLALNQEEQAIYFSHESGSSEIIQRINKNGGDPSIVVPSGHISRSYSLVAFKESTYICDTSNHRVILWSNIDKTFAIVAGGNGVGSDSKQLRVPEGIFVDVNRNVYVADTLNHRIQLWKNGTSNGTTVAGSSNLGPGLHQLNSPRAVFVDSGTIFIADSGNNRILKWNIGELRAAVVLVGSGSGPNPNQLRNPTSLKFDLRGNMYVVDNTNHRVQKYLVNNTQC
ncbi:unnamed protein product [Rotaria sp. Silwood1]|nr:unnamed protein product [Rotaria sp. Silwood1]